MANINLLPWREERRQELKQAFLIVIGGVAAIGAVLVFLANSMVTGAIEAQNGRNSYLQKQIDELSLQVKEIEELEKRKQELLDRMKVIQELQGNRPIIVRMFDELVRTLPDGAYYRSLKRTNNKIQLKGIAESNSRISSLMRRLESSEWFANPSFHGSVAKPEFGEQASEFDLSFNISTPVVDAEAE